jgi:hypothetical protein
MAIDYDIFSCVVYVHCVNATVEVVEGTKHVFVMVKREGLLRNDTQFWYV